MPKQSAQTPNWQPLSRLPLLAGTLDRALVEAEQQLQNSRKLKTVLLDDRTPSELLPCLGSKEIFAIYQEQFAWWKAQQLCPTQQRESQTGETARTTTYNNCDVSSRTTERSGD